MAPVAVPEPDDGGVPVVVWLLTAAFGLWLTVQTVLVPLYTAPDEPYHVDMVLGLRESPGYPTLGDRLVSAEVIASFGTFAYEGSRMRTPQTAADAVPRGERPTFDELAQGDDGWVNLLPQHPPLYYAALTAAFTGLTALVPGGAEAWSADVVVTVLRLLGGVALLTWLPLLAFAAARRLTGSTVVGVAAAVVPFTVPHLAKLGGAVNNDNLLTLLGGVVVVHAAHVLRGDLSRGRAARLGVVVGLALLTKAFALFLPVMVAGVYGLVALRRRDPRGVAAGAVTLAVAGAIGGWWWLRNLVLHGHVQPPGAPWEPAPPGFVPDVLAYAGHLADRFVESTWGWSGMELDPLDPVLSWVAYALTAVCVIAAFVARSPTTRATRADLAFMLVPAVGLLGLVVAGSWEVYAFTGDYAGQQGRYLFPAAVGLSVVVGVGGSRLLGARARWFPLVALLAGLVLHAVVTVDLLRDWWGAPGSLDGSVAAVVAWSPWPAPVTVALPVAAAGLLLVAAARLVGIAVAAIRLQEAAPATVERVAAPVAEAG